jgi:hypothetical protein
VNPAAAENARMLSHVLGTTNEAAAKLLDRVVVITTDSVGSRLASDIILLLARSVGRVSTEQRAGEPEAVEVVIGTARPRTSAVHVYVSMSYETVRIASEPDDDPRIEATMPAILVLVAACYAAGAIIRRMVGTALPYPAADPLIFSPAALLGSDADVLHARLDIGVAHLAGAGAVGNAFLLALGRIDVAGEVHVVDPDVVEDANLNRTLLFEEGDVGKPKATALAERAASLLPAVRFTAHPTRLQDLSNGSAWLEQLVCTVDSRRARRGLQEELPRDVYDASTSGIADVVLHFNSVASPHACLSCVYHEDRRETAHEEHVAAMLGIGTGDVRQTHLSEVAAGRVLAKYPQLAGRQLVGLACDTLFKELCATGSLGADSGQQVLAPLAFVSVLAGTMLALEFARRRFRRASVEPFNEWHLSPWTPPLLDGRRRRPRRQGCTFCGGRNVHAAFATLWQVMDGPTSGGTKED